MPRIQKKVKFEGHNGMLVGLLTMPKYKPKAYILYAHCFTCGKNFVASSRVARAFVKQGFAVFRFDFTGLAESEGDFSETGFSTNVEDIICAANYMRVQMKAPDLLVGHSLGGTAVIKAAAKIGEAKAVVCISSPAHANHIMHMFSDESLQKIESEGSADVLLAGRNFTIKKQFVDDLNKQHTGHIKNIDKALLVMHSPLDEIVDIEEAEKIYVKAQHPKSFVSLDDADHLLSNKKDTQYVADVINSWSSRFLNS